MKYYVLVFVVILCWIIPLEISSQTSSNYHVIGGDLNSGGSAGMASGNYRNSVTIGQSSPIGASNSASYQMQMGVQYIYHSPSSAPPAPNSYLLWTK